MPSVNEHYFNYGLSTRVTSYSLNHIMETELSQSFRLDKLSPRMHAMLRNQFKRGYRVSASSGQLTVLTRMLAEKFNLIPLPIISNVGLSGSFYKTNPEFSAWLSTVGLVQEFTIVDSGQKVYWPNYETSVLHYYQNNKNVIEDPREFNKLLLDRLTEDFTIFNSQYIRDEVVEFIENKETIIFNRTFV